MVDQQQLALLKGGVTGWNQWRRVNPSVQLDFSHADLSEMDLSGADLIGANMQGALLKGAHMQGTLLNKAYLEGAYLHETAMKGVVLIGAKLDGADMHKANLERALLNEAHLEGADLQESNLKRANLSKAHLEGANLNSANLERADLRQAVLGGKVMPDASLKRTDLRNALFDGETKLEGIILGNKKTGNVETGFALLADLHWGGVNLSVINGTSDIILGDEQEAYRCRQQRCDKKEQLDRFQQAIRANHQLAVALQDQRMNDESDHFAYHAQVCNRHQLWLKILLSLEELPKLRWLTVKPIPLPSSMGWLRILILFLSFICLFWCALTIGPESLTEYPFNQIILLPLTVGIVLFLLILTFYHLLMRLILASLLLLFLYLGICLGISLLVFQGLPYILFHPAFLFIVLFLLLIFIFILLIRSSLWKDIKQGARFIYLILHPYLNVQGDYGQYLFSEFLYLLAGYGYKPIRAVCWYLVTIIGFATVYYALGHLSLLPPDAFVYSLTSFHGRGFFPGLEAKSSLHNPLIVLAALEAVIGLFLEISFIATFTHRFFGK